MSVSASDQPLRHRASDQCPAVAVCAVACRATVETLLPAAVRVTELTHAQADEVSTVVNATYPTIVVFGDEVPSKDSVRVLKLLTATKPDALWVCVVFNAGKSLRPFQDFIALDRIFYVCRSGLKLSEQIGVVRAAVMNAIGSAHPDSRSHASQQLPSVIGLYSALGRCTDVSEIARRVSTFAESILVAELSEVYLLERVTHTLTRLGAPDEEPESAAAGIVSYVATTGERVILDSVLCDSRFDESLDGLRSADDCRFLAVPIISDGCAIGVLTAARDGDIFSERDSTTLSLIAAVAAPAISLLIGDNANPTATSPNEAGLYRAEALRHHWSTPEDEGNLLQRAPEWIRRTNALFLMVSVALLIYLFIARVDESATGPCIVRARTKMVMTAKAGGIVRSIEVSPGSYVRTGDLLVRFTDNPEANSMERFNAQVRALADGIVTDIRVRAGQAVGAGEHIVTVADEHDGFEVIALVPGSYVSQIRPQSSMLVRLDGYPDSAHYVPVTAVANEAVRASDATRYTGIDYTSGTAGSPVLVVRSLTQGLRFRSGSLRFGYRDGLVGIAEVSVRSQRLIESLLPPLKNVLPR